MANIFEDAWNAGKEWASETADDVEKYVTKKVIEKKFNDWGSSVTEALGGPTKMTPELEAAGWKLGIDNVPYNANLKYTGDDWARDQKNAAADARVQAAATGGATSDAGTTGSSPFKLSQDLRQRTPSGTVYNPDISEYLNSGLFNYTGPGGVSEYTYGQGLPTDGAGYDIWGTPVGPNLYYEGQYGEGYVEPTGPADSAITLPPVTMPDGVPQIPPSNNPNTTTNNNTNNNGNGNGDKDLNYFETLAAMGINPEDAPSTTFPGINDKVVQEGILNGDATKVTLPTEFDGLEDGSPSIFDGTEFLTSDSNPLYDIPELYTADNIASAPSDYADFAGTGTQTDGIIGGEEQVFGGSYNMLPNDDGIFDYTGLNRNIANDEQVFGGSYNMLPSDDGDFDYTGLNRNIANDEQVFDGKYNMLPSDDGDFNYDGVPLNPNNFSQFNPSGGPSAYDTQYTPVPYQVGGEEQVFEGKPYAMLPSDDGSFNYGSNNQANFETANNIYNPPTDNNIIRNPNQETQPYRGIYVDPRTVPEINDVQSNTTYPPTMPADYDTGSNMNLVTITDKEYEEDVPIVFNQGTTSPAGAPHSVTDNLYSYPDDIAFTVNLNGSNNNDYVPKEKTGIDEVIKYLYAGGKEFVSNLFDDPSENTPLQGPAGSTAPSYTGSIDTNDNLINLVHSQAPRIDAQEASYMGQQDPSINILMHKMAGGMNTEVDYAPGSSSAIDQIVANSLLQQQAVQPAAEHPGITAKKNLAAKQAAAQAYNTPVNVPSIFKPQPAPVASVYAAPGGPPNRPTANPVSRPVYTWKPDYAAGRW